MKELYPKTIPNSVIIVFGIFFFASPRELYSTETDLNNTSQILYQTECLYRCLGIDTSSTDEVAINQLLRSKFRLIRAEESCEDVCNWKGVECTDGLVTDIRWADGCIFLLRSIEWIPSTVESIKLLNKGLNLPIQTRKLPRALRIARMPRCDISGDIHLETLPPLLQELYLRSNKLSGHVSLLKLPGTLRLLDLSMNNIDKVYVRNEALPESLDNVLFFHAHKNIVFDTMGQTEKVDGRIQESLYVEDYGVNA